LRFLLYHIVFFSKPDSLGRALGLALLDSVQ